MRKWAYLKNPYKCNKKDTVYKIMIYTHCKKGTFVFLYCSREAVQCSFDLHYHDLSDALEDWECDIDEEGWHEIDDPLPFCQDDAFLPIRVKGRNTGNPIWDKLEILENGKWVDYKL